MENQELINAIKELTKSVISLNQAIEELKLLMRTQMSREDMKELREQKSRGK